jgi:hypothetical protein
VLVTVVYKNDKMGLVDASRLDELISSKKIKTFLRSEGWVTIGVDSVRKERGYYYKDPERRQYLKKS